MAKNKKLSEKVQQESPPLLPLPEEKHTSEKSCCLFSTMVPLVLVIFILYVSTYIGAMSGAIVTKHNGGICSFLSCFDFQLQVRFSQKRTKTRAYACTKKLKS